MAGALALGVKISCVRPVDMAHDLRKIPSRGLQQHVIPHKTINVYNFIIAPGCGRQIEKKLFFVGQAFEDLFSFIAP